MTKQREIFRSEGNWWFNRNHAALRPDGDPVLRVLDGIRPRKLLEIGCANGWRLAEAQTRYGCEVAGVDPSTHAVTNAEDQRRNLCVSIGTAERLPYGDAEFDCVVYGWCLYLVDREDLFAVAAEGARVLSPGGHIVIYDFCTPNAYSNPYVHLEGVRSFKMDYSKLWSWHPQFAIWSHEVMGFHDSDPVDVDNRLAVTVLKHVG